MTWLPLLFAIVLQANQPVRLERLPKPQLNEVAAAVADCRDAIKSESAPLEVLAAKGWQPAVLKSKSIRTSKVRGLLTKGDRAPLIAWLQKRGEPPKCELWGQIDRKQNLQDLLSVIGDTLPAKSVEKIMAAYLFPGDEILAAMNLTDSDAGPVFNIGIFAFKRGDK